MKNGKRVLALLLCLVMCLSLFPASALAEGETTLSLSEESETWSSEETKDPPAPQNESVEAPVENPAEDIALDASQQEPAAPEQEDPAEAPAENPTEDDAPEIPQEEPKEEPSIASEEESPEEPTDFPAPAAGESRAGETANAAAEEPEDLELSLSEELWLERDPSPDGDLMEAYARQELDRLLPSAPLLRAPKNVGATLSGGPRVVYQALKTPIAEVAAGRQTSTEFTVSLMDIFEGKTRWTAAEVGVDYLYADSQFNPVFTRYLFSGIGLHTALIALLSDCPYELYWFDKTSSVKELMSGLYFDRTSGDVYIKESSRYTARFPVAQEYAAAADYTTDPSKGQQVQTAVANAQAIVSNAAGLDLLGKLTEYRRQICDLVAYNSGAVSNASTPYGNPWQMIWVFDGDSSTNVVCEGYAKAFQYLCDISNIGGVTCCSVTGQMESGGTSGLHMWNIVRMPDGRNYLVDVTNCDTGTAGAPDKLFLKGYISAEGYTSYSFAATGCTIRYTYDADTRALFSQADLTLSDRNYDSGTQSSWTVSYDANGGKDAPAPQTKLWDEPLTLTAASPTRLCYDFLGWATSADAEEAEYWPGDVYNGNEDLTLYAVWSPAGPGIFQDEDGRFLFRNFEDLELLCAQDLSGDLYADYIGTEDFLMKRSITLPSWLTLSFQSYDVTVRRGMTVVCRSSFSCGRLIVGGRMEVHSNIMGRGNWVDALEVSGDLLLESMCIWVSSPDRSMTEGEVIGFEKIRFTDNRISFIGMEVYPQTEDELREAMSRAARVPNVHKKYDVSLSGNITLNQDLTVPTSLSGLYIRGTLTVPEGIVLALYSWTSLYDGGQLHANGILLINDTLGVERYGSEGGNSWEGHFTLGPTGQITGVGILQLYSNSGDPASLATGIDVSEMESYQNAWGTFLSGPISAVSPCAFADVSDETAYYFRPVYWAFKNGITTGLSSTSFAPNAGCTREQTVTFLWRMMGCPATTVKASEKFRDVKAGSYYETAVGWALENEVTTGLNATNFGVGKPCTREQFVTFLWRAAGCPAPRTIKNFRDMKAGAYYVYAISWAFENGVTTGLNETTFGVGGKCTRGQVVTFLQRYDALSED